MPQPPRGGPRGCFQNRALKRNQPLPRATLRRAGCPGASIPCARGRAARVFRRTGRPSGGRSGAVDPSEPGRRPAHPRPGGCDGTAPGRRHRAGDRRYCRVRTASSSEKPAPLDPAAQEYWRQGIPALRQMSPSHGLVLFSALFWNTIPRGPPREVEAFSTSSTPRSISPARRRRQRQRLPPVAAVGWLCLTYGAFVLTADPDPTRRSGACLCRLRAAGGAVGAAAAQRPEDGPGLWLTI